MTTVYRDSFEAERALGPVSRLATVTYATGVSSAETLGDNSIPGTGTGHGPSVNTVWVDTTTCGIYTWDTPETRKQASFVCQSRDGCRTGARL